MLIRRYEPRDFADCDWLQRSHYLRPASQEELRGKLEHPSWVALDDSWSGGGEIVGNIITSCGMDMSRVLIWSIVVAAPYRSNGIGGQLIDAAETFNEGSQLYLYVEPHNPAIKFYKKHGYQTGEYLIDHYGDGEPAVEMCKNL